MTDDTVATSGRKKRQMHTADVVRTGKQVIYPESMRPAVAIDIIQKQADFENQVIAITENFEGYFVWDAARAFYRAMFEVFGFAGAQKIPATFFSDEKPPRQITIRTGPKRKDSDQGRCRARVHRARRHRRACRPRGPGQDGSRHRHHRA